MSSESESDKASNDISKHKSKSKSDSNKMSDEEARPVLTPSGRKSRSTGLRAMPAGYEPTEHDVICAKGNDAKNHPGQSISGSVDGTAES